MPPVLTNPTFWGFIINLAGLLVGAIGVSLAVNSNRKLKGAHEATKATQRKLFLHIAAEDFSEIARLGAEGVKGLESRNWESVSELTTRLRLNLGKASGAWAKLIRDNEGRNALDAARQNADSLLQALPVGEQQGQINDDGLRQMIGRIQIIMKASSEIAGKLRAEYLGEVT